MILLTATERNSNLLTPIPHESGRIAVLKPQQRKPLNCGIFMRKNSVPHHYAGLGKALFGEAGSLGQYCNLIQSGTMIAVMLSGLKTLPTEAVMPKYIHAQNPLNKSISEIQNQLIEISNASDLTERNANFMLVLAKFLQSLGKPIEQLTIAEYVQVIEHCTDTFNAGTEPSIEKVSVSPTKAKSLHRQHEIIGHALTIFCLNPNETNRAGLKSDAVELIRMLDDLPTTPPKTSRFNILTKSKQVIAKRIPYEQAIQYQDVSLKFAGMEYSS